MKKNILILAFFGAALMTCSILSSCAKEDDDLNDLAEQEEQVDQDSKDKKNNNG